MLKALKYFYSYTTPHCIQLYLTNLLIGQASRYRFNLERGEITIKFMLIIYAFFFKSHDTTFFMRSSLINTL